MLTGFEALARAGKPVHLAIGMFDGMHLGHQSVFELARRASAAAGCLWGVLDFSPHPSAVVRPGQRSLLIQPKQVRRWKLEELGAQAWVTQNFDAEFSQLQAVEFLPWLIGQVPGVRALYVGENWRFGNGRSGDVAGLIQQAVPLRLAVVSAQRVNRDGAPISSTRIREHLLAGEIAAANELLGYAYCSLGTVVPGNRIGRQLQFPTLNLPWNPELQPRRGVYAVRVADAGGGPAAAGRRVWHPAVANYGVKPTVGGQVQPGLEAHLLGACPFGEGSDLIVEWLDFFRPEQKFESFAALTAQIRADRDRAAGFFGR